MDFVQMTTLATRLSGLSCPRCESLSYCRHGKHLGIQRYRCHSCGRTFKETTNTPLHCIHNKELIQPYLRAMGQQLSLRATAKLLEISQSTSFRWRHKLLSSLNATKPASNESPKGICQIKIPHSNKGKRIKSIKTNPDSKSILIADLHGILCIGHLNDTNHLRATSALLSSAILPHCTTAYAPSSGIARIVVTKEYRTAQSAAERKRLVAYAIKQENELFIWMQRFRGVATKYLQQYWNWYCTERSSAGIEKFAEECLGHRQILHYRSIICL